MTTKTLRDVLPSEALSYTDSPFFKHLDVEVTEKIDVQDRSTLWPGPQKNVYVWWKLANGKAVAWNENPGKGWSFPIITLK